MKVVTLGKLGPNLPIGVASPGGPLNKGFTMKPYRMAEEKQIAGLRADATNLGRYITQIMCVMVQTCGGKDVQKMNDAERQLFFGGLAMADIVYMYFYLRYEALGELLHLGLHCPRCQHQHEMRADLASLDVKVVEKQDEMYTKCTLRKGFHYMGVLRKEVTTRPPAWTVFESQDTNNMGAVRAAFIQGSIIGVDGVKDEDFAPLPDNIVDEMTKVDVEVLSKHLNDNTPGPDMAVEAKCPRCRADYIWPIDWTYDSFFGASSL